MHLSILSRTNDICFPVFRFEPKGFTMPLTHKTYAFGLFPAHECPPVSEARTPTKKAGTQRKQLRLRRLFLLFSSFRLCSYLYPSHVLVSQCCTPEIRAIYPVPSQCPDARRLFGMPLSACKAGGAIRKPYIHVSTTKSWKMEAPSPKP